MKPKKTFLVLVLLSTFASACSNAKAQGESSKAAQGPAKAQAVLVMLLFILEGDSLFFFKDHPGTKLVFPARLPTSQLTS